MTAIHCFFSGGRDSAVACFLAFQVARRRGWRFVLVHIDTTIAIRQTREYVHQYARWLGTELVIIRPERTFKEYAEKFGMWPSLYPQRYRWCYRHLKLQPLIKYVNENYKDGDYIVIGVRKNESKFRDRFYTAVFFERNYDGIKTKVWAPLLFVNESTLVRLIERLGIPRNPIWGILGFSGECLCLAGAPLHEIAVILRLFPEERKMLLEADRIIQQNRKSKRPAAPPSVYQAGFSTLTEFYEKAVKSQMTLDDFVMPYKSCEGACML
jgi:3'-phosphoadenosine 5'-phosphosulfate sulfotransferase (PAPS reductase)/FAD synthetase